MRARHLLLWVPFLFASCGTVHDWRELQTRPMTYGDCYDGLLHVVSGAGFLTDDSVSDRGEGVLQSRWRFRVHPVTRHPARYRLRAEVDMDTGTPAKGWLVRFAIDQEVVKDLRKSIDPREEDWSGAGQDQEGEAILAEALQRRLAPHGKPGAKPESGKGP